MSELADRSPNRREASTLSERASGPARPRARTYQPRISRLWWVRRPSYLLFALRELSSLFVAWFVVYLLLLVAAVHGGSDSYHAFLEWGSSPWLLVVNVVALAFVVLHAITWFNLAPQAMVIRLRGRRVPSRMVAAGHFAAWVVVSAVVAWIVLGAGP
jgi:fumarate reductase subunit C